MYKLGLSCSVHVFSDKGYLQKPSMSANIILDDQGETIGTSGGNNRGDNLYTTFSYTPTHGTQTSFLLKKGVGGKIDDFN